MDNYNTASREIAVLMTEIEKRELPEYYMQMLLYEKSFNQTRQPKKVMFSI